MVNEFGWKGGFLKGIEGFNYLDRLGKLCFFFLDMNDFGIIII